MQSNDKTFETPRRSFRTAAVNHCRSLGHTRCPAGANLFCKVLATLLCLFATISSANAAGEYDGKKILVVHSYARNFAWTADVDAALQQAFARHHVHMQTVFMDTNQKHDEAQLIAAGENAAQIMESFKPDVVITSDDNAQRYFAARYAGKRSAPSFVFCGVNEPPSTYGYPAENVTGIVEKLAWAKSLDLLRRLQPSIRKVSVLLDTRPSSLASADMIRSATPSDIEAQWTSIDTFEKWRHLVRTASAEHDALAILNCDNLTDENGHIVPASDVMLWTRDNAAVPTVGFFDYTVADGALCGVIQTGFEHGTLAAAMALRILSGERASDIPIMTTVPGLTMINLKTANKLRIEIPEHLLQEAAAIVE